MSAVYETLECMYSELKRCSECCNGDYLSYHCPLCPVWKYKPRNIVKVKEHLLVHWKTGVVANNGLCSVVCHNDHDGISERHYHCSTCPKIIIRSKKNIENHIQSCHLKKSRNDNESHMTIGKEKEEEGKSLDPPKSTESSFIRRRQIPDTQHRSVCVSPREGIFCVELNKKGPGYPIHVVKRTVGDHQSFCEHLPCIEKKGTAVRGENNSFECIHLRSISQSAPGKIVNLQLDKLDEMKNQCLITERRHEELKNFKLRNLESISPSIVEIPTDPTLSQRYTYLSVYTSDQRYWSRAGRTIVTIDRDQDTITCRCSKTKRYCLHKALGKWYSFQEHGNIPGIEQIDDENDTDEVDQIETDENGEKFRKTNKTISFNYLMTRKIPPVLPLITSVVPQDGKISPKEEKCHICSGNLVEELMSRRAKLLLMTRLVNNLQVFTKICPKCRIVYRYQEWEEGFHNFNNFLFVGLDVMRYLRAGIQNHVALGRSISILEDILNVRLGSLEIENAYLHFEALTDHDYGYTCVLCGYHPSVLIWDTFRKATFRYPVSDLAIPSNDEELGTVNVKTFWKDIEKSIILTGTNKEVAKDSRMAPSYQNWGPWIGERSRNGNVLYNTEYKKCVLRQDAEELDEALPEELLVHLLLDEKVTNIRKICREVGVKCDGSAMDMILKLRQMSISRTSFDKAYEKVFGCSGGWAVGCCRHGIVYAIKNLLRSESPRDYIDLERSLKHRPNISISDIAHLVAIHGNKTLPGFYSPNEGRLDVVSEDTLRGAEEGDAMYTADFLENQEINQPINSSQDINPTTGSNVHLSLYDWFHQENTKKRSEILRKSSLLKEIAGMVDTQAVEQLFSSSKKDIYFLNNFLPHNHMFIFRLIYHLKNKKKNKEIERIQSKEFRNLSYNRFGQLACNNSTEIETSELGLDDTSNSRRDVPSFPEQYTPTELQNQPIYVAEPIAASTNEKENEHRSVLNLIIHAVLKDHDKLSENEKHCFDQNVNYSNNVLFKSADSDRQLNVRRYMTPYGQFQHQGSSNYCGLCCINNLIATNEESNPITIQEMDKTADRLWLQMVDTHGLVSPLEPMRDREGFYAYEVLQALLHEQGYDCLHINPESIQTMNELLVGQSLMLQLLNDYGTVRLIVRLKNSQHWISIRAYEGEILLLDSKNFHPRVIDIEQFGRCVKGNAAHPGAVCFIFPNERTSGTDVLNVVEQQSDKVQDLSAKQKEGDTASPIQEEIDQTDEKSESDQRSYALRENPKQKRMSSFIYQLPRKTKRMNEVEQEVNKPTNDEEEDEDVDVQLDSSCITTTKERATEDSDDEDENILSTENERRQIDPSDVENIMPSVVKHLETIISCGLRDCDDSDHERHHNFIRNPLEVKREEADKSCFGTDEFSLKTVKYIGNILLERFNYLSRNQRNPYKDPLPTQKIRGVDDDTELGMIFCRHKLSNHQQHLNQTLEDQKSKSIERKVLKTRNVLTGKPNPAPRISIMCISSFRHCNVTHTQITGVWVQVFILFLAFDYVLEVLTKEALVYIICIKRSMPYEAADELCKISEISRKEILRKRRT